MDLFQDDLLEDYDQRSLERGLVYAQAGRVEILSCEDGKLQAMVQGTARRPYRVEVSLETGASRCSCPVGIQCKHAAAAVMSSLASLDESSRRVEPTKPAARKSRAKAKTRPEAGPADPPPAIRFATLQPADQKRLLAQSRWLERFEERAQPVSWTSGQQLVYLLSCDHGEVSLKVAVAHLGKRGWGQVRVHRQPEQMLRHMSPPRYLADQEATVELICHSPGRRNLHQGEVLCGGHGGEVLERAVASGRCFLRAPGAAALRWVEPLQVRWRLAEAEGGLGLLAFVEARPLQLLSVHPACFLDLEAGTVGRIANPPAGIDAGALLQMPPLPAPQLKRLLPELRAALPGLEVPTEVLDAAPPPAPEPQLYLWRAQLRLQHPQRYEVRTFTATMAAAWFRYGGHDLPPGSGSGPVSLEDGSRIERNGEAELARLAQLTQLGLRVFDRLAGPGMIIPHDTQRPQAPVLLQWPDGLYQERWSDHEADQLPIDPAIQAQLVALGWQLSGPGVVAGETFVPLRCDELSVGLEEAGDWFRLELEVQAGDERIQLLPLLRQLLRSGPGLIEQWPLVADSQPRRRLAPLPDGRLIELPEQALRELHDHVLSLCTRERGGVLELPAAQLLGLDGLDGGELQWHGAGRMRLRELLRQLSGTGRPRLPTGLQATLRPYQHDGLAWLQALHRGGFGALLADDMGLGKTMQVLAHLLALHEAGSLAKEPALVVAPRSLLGTWRREAERFVPALRVGVLHGSQRAAIHADLAGHHLVVTSYGTLLRDIDVLAEHRFPVVVCDEAQAVKNPGTRSWQALRRLQAASRIHLSGTPVENHLGELWAQYQLLVPGLLGPQADFERRFRLPIEEQGDQVRAALLRRRVAPFLLRRTKEAVAAELPAKTVLDVPIELSPAQRRCYEAVRLAMDDEVNAAIIDRGLTSSKLVVLEALLRLRQVCCDPRLVDPDAELGSADSGKLAWLREQLPAMIAGGRRILLFSQFTSMLALIEAECRELDIPFVTLTGRTRKRQERIDAFQAGDVPLFLISLKAGGSGLTLTAADTVIHYDPWWNPAVEAQATDRAHRIGQHRPVFVHRLIASGSIEQRIQDLQQQKRGAADALFGSDGQRSGRLDQATIDTLLGPLGED